MNLTVEELIQMLEEVRDKHKKVYVDAYLDDAMQEVVGVEEKDFGVILNIN